MPPVPGSDLAVGEQARRRAGLAIFYSLALATLFVALTWLSKETPALYSRQPWQDDPYDVLVSLDFVILPLLVAIGALRVQLCRRYATLPARRVVDLLRVCGVAIGVCLATELSEWIAVGLGSHTAAWTATTTWQVAALAVLTAATIGACLQLRRAAHRVTRVARASSQPDWLADFVALGLRVTRGRGRYRERAQTTVRWAETRVIARVRRHPVAAAALLATVLALPYVAVKIAFEGYPPALVLLSFAMPAASLFAFIVLVGRCLRIVAPREGGPPPWLFTVVVACAGGTLVFALHNSLLAHQTVGGLNALFFGGGLAAGMVSLCAQSALRRFHAH